MLTGAAIVVTAVLATCGMVWVWLERRHISWSRMRVVCFALMLAAALGCLSAVRWPRLAEVVFVADVSWRGGSTQSVAQRYLEHVGWPCRVSAIATSVQSDSPSAQWTLGALPSSATGSASADTAIAMALQRMDVAPWWWRASALILPVERRLVYLRGQVRTRATRNSSIRVAGLIAQAADREATVDVVAVSGDVHTNALQIEAVDGRLPSKVIYKKCPLPVIRLTMPVGSLAIERPLAVKLSIAIPGDSRPRVAMGPLDFTDTHDGYVETVITRDWLYEHGIQTLENRSVGIGEIGVTLTESSGRYLVSPPVPLLVDLIEIQSVVDHGAEGRELPLYAFSTTAIERPRAIALTMAHSDLLLQPGEAVAQHLVDFGALLAGSGLVIVANPVSLLARTVDQEQPGIWLAQSSPAVPNAADRLAALRSGLRPWLEWPIAGQGLGLEVDLDVRATAKPMYLADKAPWSDIFARNRATSTFQSGALSRPTAHLSAIALAQAAQPAFQSQLWPDASFVAGRHVAWFTDGQVPAGEAGDRVRRLLAFADRVSVIIRDPDRMPRDLPGILAQWRREAGLAKRSAADVAIMVERPSSWPSPTVDVAQASSFNLRSPFGRQPDNSDTTWATGPRRFTAIPGSLQATPVAWVRTSAKALVGQDIPIASIGYIGQSLVACFGYDAWYRKVARVESEAIESQHATLLGILGRRASFAHSATNDPVVITAVGATPDGGALRLTVANRQSDQTRRATIRIRGQLVSTLDLSPSETSYVTIERGQLASVPAGGTDGAAGLQPATISLLSTGTGDAQPLPAQSYAVHLLEEDTVDQDPVRGLIDLTLQTGGRPDLSGGTIARYLQERPRLGGVPVSLLIGMCLAAMGLWLGPGIAAALRALVARSSAGETTHLGSFDEVARYAMATGAYQTLGRTGEFVGRRLFEPGDLPGAIDRRDIALWASVHRVAAPGQAARRLGVQPQVRIVQREATVPIDIVIDVTTHLVARLVASRGGAASLDATVAGIVRVTALLADLIEARRCQVVLAALASRDRLLPSGGTLTAGSIRAWLISVPAHDRRDPRRYEPSQAGARVILISDFAWMDIDGVMALDAELSDAGGGLAAVRIIAQRERTYAAHAITPGMRSWIDMSVSAPESLRREIAIRDARIAQHLSGARFGFAMIDRDADIRDIALELRDSAVLQVLE